MRNPIRRPQIVIGEIEHRQLQILAMAGIGHTADAADDLFHEMDRARVVPDAALARDVVRMGSTVRYRTDTGQEQVVTPVYPAHADISAGKISVLTPVGTALIGLRAGQSISWMTRNGRTQVLTAVSVSHPSSNQ